MTARRRWLWVVGLLALVFAPAQRAAADDHHASLGAAILAPTLSSAELPRVDDGRVEVRPDLPARVPWPTPVVGVAVLLLMAALTCERPATRSPNPIHLTGESRWRGPPTFLRLT